MLTFLLRVLYLWVLCLSASKNESIYMKAASLLSVEMWNNTESPSFVIKVNNETYFKSNYFQYNAQNTSNNDTNRLLVLSISSIFEGNDFLGLFNYVDIKWSTNWITTIKVYSNKDAIAFKQTFILKPPTSYKNKNKNLDGSITNSYVFPSICKSNLSQEIGVIQYGFNMVPYLLSTFSTSTACAQKRCGGQLILSPKIYPSVFTLVYGSINEFFVQFIGPSPQKNCFSSFIPNSFSNDIPNGYSTESILIAVSSKSVLSGYQKNRILMPSSGINAAIYEYGDILLAKSNIKQRPNILENIGPSNRIKDYIGYAMDAFYFYNPCDCYTFNASYTAPHLQCNGNNTAFEGCQSYQDTLYAFYRDMMNTLNKTHSYSVMNHITHTSSWYGEVYYEGVNFWEDDIYYLSKVIKSYPDGLASFWKNTGYPSIWAHLGGWIINNTYQYQSKINNNIFGEWIDPAMPQGSTLWNYLFKQSHEWGLQLINSDHLNEMYTRTPAAFTNISICTNWVNGMSQAAVLNNIDIEYCMSLACLWLHSTTLEAVKYTRAWSDYYPNQQTYQWAIAPHSAFHFSVGLIPYKDTFYSNTTVVEACDDCRFTNFTETAPWIHAISAVMSGAMVTISDKIGSTNYTLLNKLVRNDGKILKPSVVYMPVELEWFGIMFKEWPRSISHSNYNININMQSLPNGFLGELYATYCKIDEYIWYYIWSVQITDKNIYITNHDLNIIYNHNHTKQIIIYEWDINDDNYGVLIDQLQFVEIDGVNTKTWNVNVTTRGYNNGDYGSYTMYAISEVLYLNGWILLGEVGKVLGISPVRIESISVQNVPNDQVEVVVNGIQNENIKLSFIKWKTSNVQTIQCIVPMNGILTFKINNDKFSCVL